MFRFQNTKSHKFFRCIATAHVGGSTYGKTDGWWSGGMPQMQLFCVSMKFVEILTSPFFHEHLTDAFWMNMIWQNAAALSRLVYRDLQKIIFCKCGCIIASCLEVDLKTLFFISKFGRNIEYDRTISVIFLKYSKSVISHCL